MNLGKNISRPRKNKAINNDEKRRICKEKLRDGRYTPSEYLQAISHTIGNLSSAEELFSSDSDNSEEENVEDEDMRNICVVCLRTRPETWIFMACRHANCCAECSQSLDTCPVCRSIIETKFQIYTN